MLINGRFLTRPATGVDRFATELIRAVARQAPGRAQLVVPAGAQLRAALPPGAVSVRRAGPLAGHAWEQMVLPALSRHQPLVGLCNTAPLVSERQMVVVHDAATLANPANYSPAFRAWYRVMLTAVARRARVMASVSAFSADELTRHLGRRPRGIEVIGEGGEHILREAADPAIVNQLGLAGRRYVLAVGSQSPNKNFAAVVQALALIDDPDLQLVAVGGGNPRVFASADLPCDRVLRTGHVDDAQLRALYEGAVCFVFPSFYEGFGLPPVEAMHCGCPVIAARRASLPEVCGDAVLYCDPADPATIAAHLRRLLASEALRAELAAAGQARARCHSWDRAAKDFLDIYNAGFP